MTNKLIERKYFNPRNADDLFDISRLDERFSIAAKIAKPDLRLTYLNLFRLRDDLRAFIRDLMFLNSGRKIIYMIDDVLLSSYAEMNSDNRKSFTYPIVEDSSNEELQTKLGYEYTLRLHELLINPRKVKIKNNDPDHIVYFSPALRENFIRHILYFQRKENEINANLRKFFESYEDEEEVDLDHINQALVKYEEALKNRSPIGYINNNNLGKELRETLEPLNKLDSEAQKTLQKHITQKNKFTQIYERLEEIVNSTHICWSRAGVEEYLEKIGVNGRLTSSGNGEYLATRLMDRHRQFLLQTTELKIHPVGGLESHKEADEISKKIGNFQHVADALGELLDLNTSLANISSDIDNSVDIQFVTHRPLTINMINSMMLYRWGIPVRHPKFLAARIPEDLRDQASADATRLLFLLNGFLEQVKGESLKHRNFITSRNFNAILSDFQSGFSQPWVSFKNLIYFKENFSSENEGTKAFGSSDLVPPLTQNLEYRLLNLLRAALSLWTDHKTINVKIFDVPERKDASGTVIESAHYMILPAAGHLRYVLKLPYSKINEKPDKWPKHSDQNNSRELSIADFVDCIKKDDIEFAQAVFAGATGRWEAVPSILKKDLSDQEDTNQPEKEFVAEQLYLRQFGFRGAAAASAGWLRSLKYMHDAYNDIDYASRLKKSDYRLKLAKIGWGLEMNYFVKKRGFDYSEDDSGKFIVKIPAKNTVDAPDESHIPLASTEKLARDCIDLFNKLLKERVGSNSGNRMDRKNPQEIYWAYMTGRAAQLIFMIFSAIKHQCVFDHYQAYKEIFYNKELTSDSNIRKYHDELKKFIESGKSEKKASNSRYLTSNFLSTWAEYEFNIEGTEKFTDARRIAKIIRLQRQMDNYCAKLPERGFPRELFIYVKKDIFERMRIEVEELQKKYFDSILNNINDRIKKKHILYQLNDTKLR